MRSLFLAGFLIFWSSAESKSLDVNRGEIGVLYLMGSANDSVDRVAFLIDTGASQTSFSLAAAKKFGIGTDDCESITKVATACGLVDQCKKTIKKLDIGGFVFNNIPVYILQDLAASPALMGNDLLQQFLIIQHKNGQVLTLQR